MGVNIVKRLAGLSIITRSVLRPAPAPLAHSTARHFASSSHLAIRPTPSPLAIGSGKGGKADKSAAAAAKKLKDKAATLKVKEKEKAKKDKEKAKEKEKKEKAKLKEKEKKLKLKEKEKEKRKARRVASPKAKVVKKPKTKSSLHPPKAPSNAWQLYLSDCIAAKKSELKEGEKLPSAAAITRTAAPEYRNLAPSAKADLLARFQREKEEFTVKYAEWKANLTPDMIKEENLVRFRRRKLGLSRQANLHATGEPKRPWTPFMRYSMEKRADSEFMAGLSDIKEQSKKIAAAWRELTDYERQKYVDAHAEAKIKYIEEKKKFDQEQAEKAMDSAKA
ncbi:hypothetical protein T439DRAFT_326598 [Meredithblackwellia eburnea MCA 4105]